MNSYSLGVSIQATAFMIERAVYRFLPRAHIYIYIYIYILAFLASLFDFARCYNEAQHRTRVIGNDTFCSLASLPAPSRLALSADRALFTCITERRADYRL